MAPSVIDEELYKEFQRIVDLKYGEKKGNYKRAMEEAIRDWIEKVTKGKPIESQSPQKRL